VPADVSQLEPLTRYVVQAFIAYIRQQGYTVTVTSARRSYLDQLRLWYERMMGRQPYPVARPGSSAHEVGRAVDLVVTPGVENLGELAPYFWLKWGGQRDPVHFELDCRAFDLRELPDECLLPRLES